MKIQQNTRDQPDANRHTPKTLWMVAAFFLMTSVFSATDCQAKDKSKAVYDPGRLLKIEFQIEERAWTELCGQTRNLVAAISSPRPATPFQYFRAKMSIDGKHVAEVGIRKKGFLGSLNSTRPSLKINIDKYDKKASYSGVDNLTLNNCQQDTSFASQFLTYQSYRKAGLAAPRVNFARVIVNGDDLGVYANVEPVKRSFLKRSFGSGRGTLYEGTLADFVKDGVRKFERKNNDKQPDQREELNRVAELVAAKELDLDELESVIDLEKFYRFWAMESLIGFWDGYCSNQNNYFVYANPEDKRLHFIPWGADVAFNKSVFGVMFKRGGSESVQARAALPNKLYKHEEARKRYFKTLRELLKTVFKEREMLAETQRIEKLVKPHLHKDQRKNFQSGINGIRRFIENRRQEIEDDLKQTPKSAPPGTPATSQAIGEVVIHLDTKWSGKGQLEIADEDIAIRLHEKDVPIERLRIKMTNIRIPNAPGIEPGSPQLKISGRKKGQDRKIGIDLVLPPMLFRKGNQFPAQIQGTYRDGGGFSFFNPAEEHPVCGSFDIESASRKEGEPVKGTIRLKVYSVNWGS